MLAEGLGLGGALGAHPQAVPGRQRRGCRGTACNGAGTLPHRKKPVWPAGSGAVSIVAAGHGSAFTWEAKRWSAAAVRLARVGAACSPAAMEVPNGSRASSRACLRAHPTGQRRTCRAGLAAWPMPLAWYRCRRTSVSESAAEDVALGFELAAQFAVVVDFAVEGDDELAVCAVHGLRAALGEVDDGQAAVAEGDAAVFRRTIRPWPSGPRAAMWSRMVRSSARSAGGAEEVEGVEAGYAAHGLWFRRPKTWIAALRSQ
jgi:hypothetical protein